MKNSITPSTNNINNLKHINDNINNDSDCGSEIQDEGISNYSNLLFSTEKNGKGPQAQIT